MGFEPPPWTAQRPRKAAALQVTRSEGDVETIDVGIKPYYLFGRDVGHVDIVQADAGVSRTHAALVHHEDGRIYLIDLKSTHGTTVNGGSVPGHKPVQLTDGCVIVLGATTTQYQLACDAAGEKRKSESTDSNAHKRASGTVRASHLLVKHRDVRRPSSWKEEVVTRSKEEALEMIQAFRERLVRGDVKFEDLAREESHCSSAKRGGDLGEFGPGKMQKAFEEAAFALDVGELSEPVISDSGVHLILRTA